MNILIRQRFGVPVDPWTSHVPTSDTVRIAALVQAAARSKLLVSITGERGAGKTWAVRKALRELGGAQAVEPLRLDRERLHMGDVQAAIVRDLCDESPRRSGEARSGQVRRVLGAAAARGPVVLWIDDAHLLHHATLRGLKRLRELSWRGAGPLLGIVLTGQTDRVARVPEVGLRSARMACAGLTADEARDALERALDGIAGRPELAGRAEIERLAAAPAARNWLDLDALIDAVLVEAAARGEDRVSAEAVAAVFGAAPEAADRAAPSPAADDAVTRFLEEEAA